MKITFLNLVIFLFSAFAISRVFLRFRGKELSSSGFVFWMFVWLTIFAGTLFPKTSVELAKLTGIGRGADSAFFLSILFLFYLIFRLYIKLDKVDKDITSLSIEISKKLHKLSKNKKDN